MGRRSTFAASVIVILVVTAGLRTVWLRSDPPTFSPIGIIWHDEGAWVHNARNRALWGAWRTDAWNPVFVTPVFTGLEYGAFRLFGVGLWQARTVPVASGVIAVLLLMAGLSAVAGRRAALLGGALLAVNYVFVMWNRAALIESTMTACVVAGWAAYARAERRPIWGLAAGSAAALAWFTKASAAFFVAAVLFNAMTSLVARGPDETERRSALFAIAGVGVTFAMVSLLFVWPNWEEYRFYNWQMSVLRKPEFTLHALIDRASWLPVVQGTFARMWPVLALAAVAVLAIAAQGARARPADRLLVLWLVLGLAELVVHDSGNERRYLMFVPVLVALAARVATSAEPLLSGQLRAAGWLPRTVGAALLLALGYLVVGSACRLLLETDVTAGRLSTAVRIAAGTAIAVTVAALVYWTRAVEALAAWTMPRSVGIGLLALGLMWNVPDYVGWLRHLDDKNFAASVALGRLLPPETLVQGKLANGMALDNRIRPIFIGNGFGNYEDRLRREDVHYLLTYDLPRIGYESSDGSGLIEGILDHYPLRRVVATFDVDETPDTERAVLIVKTPARAPTAQHIP